jgi:hypothetical protein
MRSTKIIWRKYFSFMTASSSKVAVGLSTYRQSLACPEETDDHIIGLPETNRS